MRSLHRNLRNGANALRTLSAPDGPRLWQSSAEVRYIPSSVKLYEMGPRDGLQNQSQIVPTATKVAFINDLTASGLRYIEASSFVSKQWVPQMGDAEEVCRAIAKGPGVTYSALVPNMKGMEAAVAAGLQEVAVFAAATDSFSKRNINCNVMDSFERFKPVMELARGQGVRVRGYVSCALGCPYEGEVAPDAVGFVAQSLLELGCYEISLGDTIGVGTPSGVKRLLSGVKAHVPVHALAVHFHDTYGQGVANVLAALEEGVSVVDASVAGLGGCPYARGASGNVSTEDVLYLLTGLGVEHGVDVDALVTAGDRLCKAVGIPNRSKVATARLSHRESLASAEADMQRLQGVTATAAAGGQGGAEEAAAAAAALSKARRKAQDASIALRWPEAPPAPARHSQLGDPLSLGPDTPAAAASAAVGGLAAAGAARRAGQAAGSTGETAGAASVTAASPVLAWG